VAGWDRGRVGGVGSAARIGGGGRRSRLREGGLSTLKIGITCYPTYGGSGAIAAELGIGLAARGHELHFISYAQPFRLSGFHEGIYFHEVEMYQYPLFEYPAYSLALAVAMHQVSEEQGLDVLHVHYAIPHATSAWMASEMFEGQGGPRIMTTLHGTDITLVGQHPSFHSITRFSILRSHGLTAVSQYLSDETTLHFGVDPSRIEVIPNFVDTQRYRRGVGPCHRASLAAPEEKILMHISNFRSVKRVEDVVAIFAGVQAALPSRLIMVGDGPERPRAQQAAHELGVTDRVRFLGKHEAVEDLLSCADLFLLPSESESFGLAALEAMSCEVPVIATRVGGLPEVVIEGESGRLFPVGEVEAMAEAAIEILRSPELWTRMSTGARAMAVERFDSEAIIGRYEASYERILGREASV